MALDLLGLLFQKPKVLLGIGCPADLYFWDILKFSSNNSKRALMIAGKLFYSSAFYLNIQLLSNLKGWRSVCSAPHINLFSHMTK